MVNLLISLIFLLSSVASAKNGCDFSWAAKKQKDFIETLMNYQQEKANQLMMDAADYPENSIQAKLVRQLMVKLAAEKFTKYQFFLKIKKQMDKQPIKIDSVTDYKQLYENAVNVKFVLKSTAKLFETWIKGLPMKGGGFSNLKKEVLNEVLEKTLENLGLSLFKNLNEIEALYVSYFLEISVKAGIEVGGALITGETLTIVGSSSLTRWAGGPAGVLIMVAPLLMGGMLPPEQKWFDLIEKNPELVLMPEKMIEAKILGINTLEDAYGMHCRTWVRFENWMTESADKIIEKDEQYIARMIRRLQNDRLNTFQQENYKYNTQDGTYIPRKFLRNF